MSETARVVQLWPVELKEQVREAAGKGSLTEFTIKAVSIQLGIDEDLSVTSKQLNEVKFFAQQLADQLVLGGDREDRLQALLEIEFPSWIDTSGWPPAFADRVRPDDVVLDLPEDTSVRPDEETGLHTLDPKEAEALEVMEEVVEIGETAKEELGNDGMTDAEREDSLKEFEAGVGAKPRDKDDLFARVMAKTGGALTDVPGLKLASQIPAPAPVEASNVCPNCKEELVDGECWTCG